MPRKHLAGGALVAVAIGVAVALWPRKPIPDPPPVFGVVPEFEMVGQDGERFTSATKLRGHVWLANFIFTRCTTVCPVLTQKVKQVEEATRQHDDLRVVSFTVDPDHDTPEILRAYAKAGGLDLRRWSFLRGDPAPIAAAMKIGLDRIPDKPPGESIIHGSHIVLVDREMKIRGYYNSNDEEALARLISDAARLSRSE